jgi:hypothetical protein
MEEKQATPEKKRNSGAVVRLEPRTPSVIRWDPKKLVLARERCTYGDFSLFSDLCEAMLPDGRIASAIDKLYSATTLPLTFQMPGLDVKASEKDPICQALAEDWWKAQPEEVLKSVLGWIALANCALVHVDGWRRDTETGRLLPILSVWSLRHLRHDPEKGWVVRVSRSPSDYFGSYEEIEPGDGNWAILLFGASWKAISQARGHGIATFWLLKQYALVDWPSSSERHGQGTNVAETDKEWRDHLDSTDRKNLASDMAKMARNGTIVMPEGWVYRLVTDSANSHQTFLDQINAADSGITIGIVGTNLTTEVKGGSLAAAGVHASVDAGRMRGLLEFLSTGLRSQIWVHWAAYNWAGGIAPYANWDTTPPVDKEAECKARSADATALLTYRKAGLQLNQRAWVEGRVELLKSATDEFPALATVAPTTAEGDDSEDDGDQPKLPPKQARKAMAQARAEAAPLTAFDVGRSYVDRLEDECCKHAAAKLAPFVATVMASIEGATSFEDAEAKIKAAYADEATPTKLVQLTAAALILGQLAGRETVEFEAVNEE